LKVEYTSEDERPKLNKFTAPNKFEHLISGSFGIALHDTMIDEPFLQLGIGPARVNCVSARVIILLHELDESLALFLGVRFNDVM